MADQLQKDRPKSVSSTRLPAPRHMKVIFLSLIILRLVNALTLKTFFQPDEYFQSLEPAILSAFGPESNPWITWEWQEGLRSSLHPLIFGTVYKAADSVVSSIGLVAHLQANALVAAPKVAQALCAAFIDVYTYRFACDVYGSATLAAWATLALTVLSPWMWFASVRTLSNSLETMLTVIALRLWPWEFFIIRRSVHLRYWDPEMMRLSASLVPAAIACILRPTNIIIWIAISLALVIHRGELVIASKLAAAAWLCGSAVLAMSISADQAFYGRFILPPLRFLRFNVVQSLAVFYGRNRPDYYLTEGVPLLLTTALPFAIVGIWQTLRPSSRNTSSVGQTSQGTLFTLVVAIVASIAIFSLISHKEVRFIFPLLPMLHILAAKPMADFFQPAGRNISRLILLITAILINLNIIYYTAFVHQRGVIDVMHYLRHQNEAKFDLAYETYTPISVGFFMPCHSTPWRSHFIYPEINAWALTCEPPIGLTMEERETYLDEADVFYANPTLWVRENMEHVDTIAKDKPTPGEGEVGKRKWPEYIVFFEQLEPFISMVLHHSSYRECWRGFNTHWHDDSRREGDVVVWCSLR